MITRHCYLFSLEVDPLEVDKAYDELPLHCTLMPRFWTGLPPEDLANAVRPLFAQTPPLSLTAHERARLGPQQKSVSLITLTNELDRLNMLLYQLLNKLGATYNNPEWAGQGHIFHITDQKGVCFIVGRQYISTNVYLIEVKIPEYEHKKIVRKKFVLR